MKCWPLLNLQITRVYNRSNLPCRRPDSKFDSILVFKPIINQEVFICDLFVLGVGS